MVSHTKILKMINQFLILSNNCFFKIKILYKIILEHMVKQHGYKSNRPYNYYRYFPIFFYKIHLTKFRRRIRQVIIHMRMFCIFHNYRGVNLHTIFIFFSFCNYLCRYRRFFLLHFNFNLYAIPAFMNILQMQFKWKDHSNTNKKPDPFSPKMSHLPLKSFI